MNQQASGAARRTALITGASSGIGESFAEVFASEGFNLVITARREERLRSVASRLNDRYGATVDVVPLDLAAAGAPEALFDAVESLGRHIDALVNNAGYGLPGAFLASDLERHRTNVDVMVLATAELTHRFLPGMLARGYGRIINVASLAALVPPPAGHTLYAASKAFVVKFSEALAHEVRSAGVHVTALCPGFTLSEFHDVTGTRAQVSRMPTWMWMTSQDVARLGFDACMSGTTVYIPGRVNRAIAFFARHLPERVLVTAGRRTAKLYRKN